VRTTLPLPPTSGTNPQFRKEVVWPGSLLFVAGLRDIAWAIGLKSTEGFTRLWPIVGTVVAMIASLWLLGIAMRSLPVGTAYSVWVGVGTAGWVAFGMRYSESLRTRHASSALRSSLPAS